MTFRTFFKELALATHRESILANGGLYGERVAMFIFVWSWWLF